MAMILFFLLVGTVLSQTEFQLPPNVPWEDMSFEGFISPEEVEVHGRLRYLAGPNPTSRLEYTYMVAGRSVSLTNITLFSPAAVQSYTLQDGQCLSKFNSAPRKCNPWALIPGKLLAQTCLQVVDSVQYNTTTLITLAGPHVATLEYTVVVEGVIVAGLSVYNLNSTNTAMPPAPSVFVPPPVCTSGKGPFDPNSCSGPPLELSSKFPAGTRAVGLVNYTLVYEQRPCTQFTGCGEWIPSKPSWGPSGKGTVWLKVTTNGIVAAIVDKDAGSAYGTPIYNLGTDCTSSNSGYYDCDRYYDTEITEGVNFLRFGGTGKFDGVEMPIAGYLLEKCARFYGTAQGPVVQASWTEYRAGFINSF